MLGYGFQAYVRSISGVCGLDCTGDLAGRTRRCAAASCDLNLSAADIKLRRAAGVVDRKRLDSEQILAIGNALGNLVGIVGCETGSASNLATIEGKGGKKWLTYTVVARSLGRR